MVLICACGIRGTMSSLVAING